MLSPAIRRAASAATRQFVLDTLEPRQMFATVNPSTVTSFVADWPLDGFSSTSGTSAYVDDDAGNAATWQVQGYVLGIVNGKGVTPQPGVFGKAIPFNGTTMYASASAAVGSNTNFSISMWVKPTSLQNAVLASKAPDDASGAGLELSLTSSGSVVFKVGSLQNNTAVSTAASKYSAGAWTQVVATFQGGVASVYVNGQLAASQSGITQSTADQNTSINFARSVGTGASYFNGLIDAIRVYSTAISPSAVTYQYQVDQLPEVGFGGSLQKQTLNWEVSDALDSEAYYNASPSTSRQWALNHANGEYSDLSALLPQVTAGSYDMGSFGSTPTNLFPVFKNLEPGPDHNLGFDSAMSGINSLATASNQYRFRTAHAPKSDVNGWSGQSLGNAFNDGMNALTGITHPQSLYSVNGSKALPKFITPIMRRFQSMADGVNVYGNKADFGLSAGLATAFYQLNTIYPNLIPPTLRKEMSDAITTNASALHDYYGATYRAETLGALYANADVKRIEALAITPFAVPSLAGLYDADVRGGLNLIAKSMLPDGASPYVNTQNEQFEYHSILVSTMANVSQITGNLAAANIVRQTYWYYPLNFQPTALANPAATSGGVSSSATEPQWKHYWNPSGVYGNSLIVAAMTGSPENYAIARQGLGSLGWAGATYWNPTLTTTPFADDYLTYDLNQAGPRGRVGEWSFDGSAAQIHNPDGTGDGRGPSSYVGAMVQGPNGGISGAIDYVGIGVEPTWKPGLLHETATSQRNTSLVASNVAALAATYTPSAKDGNYLPNWTGKQSWIFTKQRLVGQLTMTAKVANTSLSVQGIINLVGANVSSGTLTQDATDPSIYYMGNLAIHLISTDFGSGLTLTQKPSSTATGSALALAIRDNAVSTSTVYPAGATRSYMIEFYDRNQTTASSAANVSTLSPGNGLTGLSMTQGSGKYSELFNPTGSPLTYTVPADGSFDYYLHTSGPTSAEEYRAPFLSTYDTSNLTDWRNPLSKTAPNYRPAGGFTITIPAYSQILIERITASAPTVAVTAPTNVAGKTATLGAVASETGDNPSPTYTYAWSVLDTSANKPTLSDVHSASPTATFTKSGTYGFTVTATDVYGRSLAQTVNVIVDQTLTALTVQSSLASTPLNGQATFSATGYDQFGDTLATAPSVTWSTSTGSISSAGVFTAPGSPVSATVTATAGVVSGSTSIAVVNTAPTISSPASSSVSNVTGTNVVLKVLEDDDGTEPNLTYTWSVVGTAPAPVTFAQNGTNVAKNTTVTFTAAGTYSFTVKAVDAFGLSVSSDVNVTVVPTLASVRVTPASPSVTIFAASQFSGTAVDQFGTALASQPASYTWSSSAGTISTSGLFTAPTTPSTVTVTASTSGVSGSSSVNVVAPAAQQANLAPQFNAVGFYANGTQFSKSGGLTRQGASYPAAQLPTSVNYKGLNLTLGAANVKNAFLCSPQTTTLPQGHYTHVVFLGACTNTTQSSWFTVYYTDGSKTDVSQSLSRWTQPSNYAGESVVATTSYQVNWNGTTTAKTSYVYAYELAINSDKVVSSIKWPNTQNDAVLAVGVLWQPAPGVNSTPTTMTPAAVSPTIATRLITPAKTSSSVTTDSSLLGPAPDVLA